MRLGVCLRFSPPLKALRSLVQLQMDFPRVLSELGQDRADENGSAGSFTSWSDPNPAVYYKYTNKNSTPRETYSTYNQATIAWFQSRSPAV